MPDVSELLTPALVLALFAWLERGMWRLNDRLGASAKDINARIDASNDSTNHRIDRLNETVNQRFDGVLREVADLRERMAKMEGSLDGFLAGRRDRDAA